MLKGKCLILKFGFFDLGFMFEVIEVLVWFFFLLVVLYFVLVFWLFIVIVMILFEVFFLVGFFWLLLVKELFFRFMVNLLGDIGLEGVFIVMVIFGVLEMVLLINFFWLFFWLRFFFIFWSIFWDNVDGVLEDFIIGCCFVLFICFCLVLSWLVILFDFWCCWMVFFGLLDIVFGFCNLVIVWLIVIVFFWVFWGDFWFVVVVVILFVVLVLILFVLGCLWNRGFLFKRIKFCSGVGIVFCCVFIVVICVGEWCFVCSLCWCLEVCFVFLLLSKLFFLWWCFLWGRVKFLIIIMIMKEGIKILILEGIDKRIEKYFLNKRKNCYLCK